jgi:hypothetical protein
MKPNSTTNDNSPINAVENEINANFSAPITLKT